MAAFKTSACDQSSRERGKATANVEKGFKEKVRGVIKYLRDIT